jgi:hypothetical protein
VFQLFALASAENLGEKPGRSDIVDAIAGAILGAGVLIGTYARDEAELVANASPAMPLA